MTLDGGDGTNPGRTTAEQIKDFFDAAGGIGESTLAKLKEYDDRLRAVNEGTPLKPSDKLEDLLKDFKQFTGQDWTEDFDFAAFKEQYEQKTSPEGPQFDAEAIKTNIKYLLNTDMPWPKEPDFENTDFLKTILGLQGDPTDSDILGALKFARETIAAAIPSDGHTDEDKSKLVDFFERAAFKVHGPSGSPETKKTADETEQGIKDFLSDFDKADDAGKAAIAAKLVNSDDAAALLGVSIGADAKEWDKAQINFRKILSESGIDDALQDALNLALNEGVDKAIAQRKKEPAKLSKEEENEKRLLEIEMLLETSGKRFDEVKAQIKKAQADGDKEQEAKLEEEKKAIKSERRKLFGERKALEQKPGDPPLAQEQIDSAAAAEAAKVRLDKDIEAINHPEKRSIPERVFGWLQRNSKVRMCTGIAVSAISAMTGAGSSIWGIRALLGGVGGAIGWSGFKASRREGKALRDFSAMKSKIDQCFKDGKFDQSLLQEKINNNEIDRQQVIDLYAQMTEVASAKGKEVLAAVTQKVPKTENLISKYFKNNEFVKKYNRLDWRVKAVIAVAGSIGLAVGAGAVGGALAAGAGAGLAKVAMAKVLASGAVQLGLSSMQKTSENDDKRYAHSDEILYLKDQIMDRFGGGLTEKELEGVVTKREEIKNNRIKDAKRGGLVVGGLIGLGYAVLGHPAAAEAATMDHHSASEKAAMAAGTVKASGGAAVSPDTNPYSFLKNADGSPLKPSASSYTYPGTPDTAPVSGANQFPFAPDSSLRPSASPLGEMMEKTPGTAPAVPPSEHFNFFEAGKAGDAHREAFMAEMREPHGSERAAQEILLGYAGKHPEAHLDPVKYHDQFVAARDALAKDLEKREFFNADGSLAPEYANDSEVLSHALNADQAAKGVVDSLRTGTIPVAPVSAQENVYGAEHALGGATPHLEGTPLPEAANTGEIAKGSWADRIFNRFNPNNWLGTDRTAHTTSAGVEHGYNVPHVDHEAVKSLGENVATTTKVSFDQGSKVDMGYLKQLIGYDDVAKHGYLENENIKDKFRPWITRMIDGKHIKEGDARMALNGDHYELRLAVPHTNGMNADIKTDYLTFPLKPGATIDPAKLGMPFSSQAEQPINKQLDEIFNGTAKPDAAQHAQNAAEASANPVDTSHSTQAAEPQDRSWLKPEGRTPNTVPSEAPAEPAPHPVEPTERRLDFDKPSPAQEPEVPLNEVPVPESPFYITDYMKEHQMTYSDLKKISPEWFKQAEAQRAATPEGINYGKIILDFGKHLDRDRADYEKLINLGKK